MAKPTADFSGTDVLQVAADLAAVRQPFALVIVVEARGSAAVRTGAKTILDGEGTVLAGWVGGGSTASAIVRAAIESLQTETPQLIDLDLDEEMLATGIPASGQLRVYVEPVLPAREPQATRRL